MKRLLTHLRPGRFSALFLECRPVAEPIPVGTHAGRFSLAPSDGERAGVRGRCKKPSCWKAALRWWGLLGLGMVLLFGGLQTSHGADYSFSIGNATWQGTAGGYSPFSTTPYPNTVPFTITKIKNGKRNYYIAAGPSATSGSYNRQMAGGGSRLNYQLYLDSSLTQVWEAQPAATFGQVMSGTIAQPDDATLTLSYLFYVPPGQMVLPGDYSDSVTISIYGGTFPQPGNPDQTQIITLTVHVSATAALAVVPSGGPFANTASQNLDFGVLQGGQRQSCDILVRKNTACRLSVSSDNQGALKLVGGSETIAYVFDLQGAVSSLINPINLVVPGGLSASSDGERYPVGFTSIAPGNATAGKYQDQVTITLTVQ